MSTTAMSSAQEDGCPAALCLHKSVRASVFLHRAKPVSETERSGVERALRTGPERPGEAAGAPPSEERGPGRRTSPARRLTKKDQM